MVVIIPVLVGVWYAHSKQYGEKVHTCSLKGTPSSFNLSYWQNVMYRTYQHYVSLLTEHHRLKMMPEVSAACLCDVIASFSNGSPFQVFAAAEEYFQINAGRLSEKEVLMKLHRDLMVKLRSSMYVCLYLTFNVFRIQGK
jgi:hypothetical protein